jgi:hypothetical protein
MIHFMSLKGALGDKTMGPKVVSIDRTERANAEISLDPRKRTKRHWLSRSAVLAPVLVFMFVSALAAGPISSLYLTDGRNGTIYVIQGSSVINSWAQAHPENHGEGPIAVLSTVRTAGAEDFTTGASGSEYTLSGVYTGATYPGQSGGGYYDGATDGVHNYFASLFGNVYQTNLDWSNPTLLFNAGSQNYNLTYDPTNNSLWIGGWVTGGIADYTLGGRLLSSFDTGLGFTLSGLALDPADNTLWFAHEVNQTLYQFTKTGTFLSSEHYSQLGSADIFGAEFQFTTPEPGTFSLGVVACLAIAWRRRRSGQGLR